MRDVNLTECVPASGALIIFHARQNISQDYTIEDKAWREAWNLLPFHSSEPISVAAMWIQFEGFNKTRHGLPNKTFARGS